MSSHSRSGSNILATSSSSSSSCNSIASLSKLFGDSKETSPSDEGDEERTEGRRREQTENGGEEEGAAVGEGRKYGQPETQTDVKALDFSMLALHLLQQAQSQELAGDESSGGHEEVKVHKQSDRPYSVGDDGTDRATAGIDRSSPNMKSTKSSNGCGQNGAPRRTGGGKSVLSATAAAALMAPSPLSQVPSIPGAIAVAFSPAAQLFPENDWSWHRNPAAAIRSGGTNKQTPVWKYFVYNKAENLSRCIVGNCTYQLKGPHTSTLACHLKKHVAEYAEFQRLKAEYTRERIASGHGQALSVAENYGGTGDSNCSTPCSQEDGNSCNASARATQSPNPASRSPFAVLAPKCTFGRGTAGIGNCQQQQQNGNNGLFSLHPSMPYSTSPGPVPSTMRPSFGQLSEQQQQQPQPLFAQSVAQRMQLNGGIGGFLAGVGSNGNCLPPQHFGAALPHFMMAAAFAAAQQQQHSGCSLPPGFFIQQRAGMKCNPVESVHSPEAAQPRPHCCPNAVPNPFRNLAQQQPMNGHNQQHPFNGGKCSLPFPLPLHPPSEMGPPNHNGNDCTGANLLDILNLLSKEAVGPELGEVEQPHKGKGRQEEGDEEEEEKQEDKPPAGREENKGESGDDRQQPQTAMRRRKTLKRMLPRQAGEKGSWQKQARMEEMGQDRQRQQQQNSTLAHSVEHLLGSGRQKEVEQQGEEEEEGEGEAGTMPSGDDVDGGMLDAIALSLGTGLSHAELCRLLANPFMQTCCAQMSLDKVEEVMRNHFQRMKALLTKTLANSSAAAPDSRVALLAEICCADCWNVPSREGRGCSVKVCRSYRGEGEHGGRQPEANQPQAECAPLLCVLSASVHGQKEQQQQQLEEGAVPGEGHCPPAAVRLLLAVRRIERGDWRRQLGEILRSVGLPAGHPPLPLFIRPAHLAVHLQRYLEGNSMAMGQQISDVFPALVFSDILLEVLATDDGMCKMFNGFRRILEKFVSNAQCQQGWRELTGQILVLPSFNGGADPVELLQIAEPLLKRRDLFMNFAGEEMLEKEGRTFGQKDWQLLEDLTRLLRFFQHEIRDRLIGEIPVQMEKLQATLRNEFPSLGELSQKLCAVLAERMAPLFSWQQHTSADCAHRQKQGGPPQMGAAAVFPCCQPVRLADVFTEQWKKCEGMGDGDASNEMDVEPEGPVESSSWLETRAMLLFNSHLLSSQRVRRMFQMPPGTEQTSTPCNHLTR